MGRKLVITLLVICLVLLGLWWVDHTRQASKALPVYSGPVEGLKHTIVAPTLDEPLAAGKNVVWSAALQLAWDELREAAGGVPLKSYSRSALGRQVELSAFRPQAAAGGKLVRLGWAQRS